MFFVKPVLLLILLVVLLPWAILPGREAYAAQGDCWGVTLSANEELALGRVTTTPRVNFLANPAQTPGCPSAESACRLKAFLVPGDDVLIVARDGPSVCATFKSPRGAETNGWLPRAALSLPTPKPASAQAWVGKWRRDGEAEIDLRSHDDEVEASGQASWGGSDPQRVREGAVHTGEISGKGEPRDGILTIGYADGSAPPPPNGSDCAARLRLLGRYLVVEDNGACGGVNVSFTGVYVRN
jgi:hypothetical protein